MFVRASDPRPMAACLLVSAGMALFAWHQNSSTLVGGPASLPQLLWLNLTVLVFLLMPLFWWRSSGLHPDLRILFAVAFVAFFLRALIELPILYLTTAWQCVYGIAHDLSVFAILGAGYLRSRPRLGPSDALGERFLWLYLALLLAEAWLAWTFSQLASPAAGIYFAADSPHFATLNLQLWAAVIPAYPLLGLVVARWVRAPR